MADPFIPTVDSWKWLEHRHMTNICERWSKNHLDALQYAFFSATGFESWENVWGNFNRITPRDGEATRRVATLLRFLGKRGYTISPHWYPHAPTLAPNKLFASAWPAQDNTSCAWTIVNRNRTSSHTGPVSETTLDLTGLRRDYRPSFSPARRRKSASVVAFGLGRLSMRRMGGWRRSICHS